MKFLKNISVIICLLAQSQACGMKEAIKKIRDSNPFGLYSDAKMMKALEEHNMIRIHTLLQRCDMFGYPMSGNIIEYTIVHDDHALCELLLKHNAPVEKTTLKHILLHNKTKAAQLLVTYKPDHYNKLRTLSKTSHESIIASLFWYVDIRTLYSIGGRRHLPHDDIQYFTQWIYFNYSQLDRLPTIDGIDIPSFFTSLFLKMPNLTPPSEIFATFLERELDPKNIPTILKELQATGQDINPKSFELVVDVLIGKNFDETALKECYLLYKDNDTVRPIVCSKVLTHLCKIQRDKKFMHNSMCENV